MTDKLSNSDLVDLVYKQIDLLNSFKYNICRDNFVEIAFCDLKNILGETHIVDNCKFKLYINIKLSNTIKESFLLNVIFHELCHVIQFNEAFCANIIYKDKKSKRIVPFQGKETLAINTVFDNFGHTKLWCAIVNEINNIIKLNPPITSFIDEINLDKFLEGIFMQADDDIYYGILRDEVVSGFKLDDVEKYSKKINSKIEINEQISIENLHKYRDFLSTSEVNL